MRLRARLAARIPTRRPLPASAKSGVATVIVGWPVRDETYVFCTVVAEAPALEEVGVREELALVLGNRRQTHASLKVEHEVLLGLRGLPHGVRQCRRELVVRRLAPRRRQVPSEHHPAGPADLRQRPYEHQAALLLVDPAVERLALRVRHGGKAVVDRRLERIACPQERDDPDGGDHEHRQHEERPDQPAHQGAPGERLRQAHPYESTCCPTESMSNLAARAA